MSDTGKHISDVVSDGIAAFDEAIATIKANGNVASDDLLDALQASYNRLAALARQLEHVV